MYYIAMLHDEQFPVMAQLYHQRLINSKEYFYNTLNAFQATNSNKLQIRRLFSVPLGVYRLPEGTKKSDRLSGVKR